MIYFIQAGDNGFIKIGHAADVYQSLKSWQEGSPVPLKLLISLNGSLEAEAYLHAKFLRLRQHGKWFKPGKEIFDFIERPLFPPGLLVSKPNPNGKKVLNTLNQLLLKIKYQNRIEVEWQDMARELGMTTDKLYRLRYEGFYGELCWEQIQRLAKFLNVGTWELVRLVEEGFPPDEMDSE